MRALREADLQQYNEFLFKYLEFEVQVKKGHTVESAGVTQFPNYRVIEKKQAVTLRCDPISGHASLYWYRRAVGKEIKFLVYFLRKDKQDDSGMPNERFSAERTEGTFSTLKVQHSELEDSGVYFCASSQDTVLQSHSLPV
uniref:Ig-like domain-containing protein n=1 Tax=Equus caballus TaxID=9796 RepID=A0A9L0TIG3_HORSE